MKIDENIQNEVDQIIHDNYMWYNQNSPTFYELKNKLTSYVRQKQELEKEKLKVSLLFTQALSNRKTNPKIYEEQYQKLMDAIILLQHLIFGKPFEYEEQMRQLMNSY